MPNTKSEAKNITTACAGWTVAKEHGHLFPAKGSHLERYVTLFDAVEINATFYHLPKAETVAKWRDTVPADFRFAVKMAKDITHIGRLKEVGKLPLFLERVQVLGEKLGPILVQLPPSLSFEPVVAEQFFTACRLGYEGYMVLEPRHLTWFSEAASSLLEQYKIALVAADPAINPTGTTPGGWAGLQYYRLHGSPKMYYSEYGEPYLNDLATLVSAVDKRVPVWVIFDNTASGAAVSDGLYLINYLKIP